jgi:L-asparaginase
VSERRRIQIITTGGTIGSRIDPATGGAIPLVSADELVAMSPGLDDVGDIYIAEFGRLQSWNIGPRVMSELALHVQHALHDGAAGVVVTHGTDTMEETAFALDLLVDSSAPIVVTGAMRNASDAGFDGPRNLVAAARVAASDAARGRGAMVVMNDEIHAARFVTKTHTTAFDTFASPEAGPIGMLDDRGVWFRTNLEPRPKLVPRDADPRVYLVKMAAGTDDLLLRALIDASVDGVVIEGSGAGNVPDAWHEPIDSLVRANIPVVLVSRCLTGRIVPAYGGRGGGRTIHSLGIIDGGSLSGQKARVALALALASGFGSEELRGFFAALTA